jgi:hypothetical protein
MKMSTPGLKAFGACISCPAMSYKGKERAKDCVFKEMISLKPKEIVNSLRNVKLNELDLLNNKCKECCKMKIQSSIEVITKGAVS